MKGQNIFRKFESWLERWFDTISLLMFLIAVGWGLLFAIAILYSIVFLLDKIKVLLFKK